MRSPSRLEAVPGWLLPQVAHLGDCTSGSVRPTRFRPLPNGDEQADDADDLARLPLGNPAEEIDRQQDQDDYDENSYDGHAGSFGLWVFKLPVGMTTGDFRRSTQP
jgi:hypothetical protein